MAQPLFPILCSAPARQGSATDWYLISYNQDPSPKEYKNLRYFGIYFWPQPIDIDGWGMGKGLGHILRP